MMNKYFLKLRQSLSLLALLLATGIVYSQEILPSMLRVNLKNQQTPADILLSDGMELAFTGEKLEIRKDDATISYLLDNVRGFNYVSLQTSKSSIHIETPRISISDSRISVTDAHEGSRLIVYNISGIPVVSENFNNSIDLSLTEFGSGIFVILINDIKLKVSLP